MTSLLLNADQLADHVRSVGVSSLFADARMHGVLGLLGYTAGPHLHPEIDDLRRRLMIEERLMADEMRRVIDAFGHAGVKVVILKGGALAYTHYPEPWCRPRVDLDLLVARSRRADAAQVLGRLGYCSVARVHGELVNQQEQWQRQLTPHVSHAIDLHVEVSNRAFFASRLRAHDLLERAVVAPFAGPSGWQLDAIDALMLSCVHRVAHHSGESRLIWSADVSRQSAALAEAQIVTLIARATTAGVAAICANEIDAARQVWGGQCGASVDAVVMRLRDLGRTERSRAFLREGRGRLGDLWLDLWGLTHWTDRVRLLLEHVAPPAAYIRGNSTVSPVMLPWLYVRRLVRGAVRWTRR